MWTNPPGGGWRLWLGLGVSLYGLNLLLSFHNAWPTPWIRVGHDLSPEILGLILLLALLAERGRDPSPRTLTWLSGLLLFMALGRYADVTAPALYGRRINLYWDAQHIPGVAAMLIQAASPWQLLLAGSGLAAGLTTLFLGLRWMLGHLARGLEQTAARRVLIGACVALLSLFAASRVNNELGVRGWFSRPVLASYAAQAAFIAEAMRADAGREPNAAPLPESSLSRLAGADVLVVFIESYGVTTLDRPEHRGALADSRRRLAAAIASTGREAVSARVRSPTFGSGSWLAHLSFLSGIEVPDSGRYRRLMTQPRETLVHRFASHGYRVLGVMPGIRMAWPEGAFYGYDKVYDAAGLDYRGPELGWWRIPDQFTLARLEQRELTAGPRAPVFVVFPTISSHAPFRPVAPYQPDWRALLGPEPFGPDGAEAELSRKPDWSNMGSGYVEAIGYVLTTIAGFLERHADEDLVLILMGDHQPASSVTGPNAPWDVPVHIVTGQPGLAAALRAQGFVNGLDPGPSVLAPMSDLAGKLLRAFD